MKDAFLKLSDAQAVTASAVSENTVDLGSARNIGSGQPLYMVFSVDTTAASAGSTTVEFQAVTSANADLSSADVLASTGPIAKADLTAGRNLIVLPIPPDYHQPLGKRYLGANYVVNTANLSAGAFTCYVTEDAPSFQDAYYPSGFTVV